MERISERLKEMVLRFLKWPAESRAKHLSDKLYIAETRNGKQTFYFETTWKNAIESTR
jgi:hypothetical protein